MKPSPDSDVILSQEIARLTDALKKAEEDKKRLEEEQEMNETSSFKVCPYRRGIFWVALSIQVLSVFIFILTDKGVYIPVSQGILALFCIFSYIGASILGEFLIYRVFKKKDSEKAEAKILEKKYHLTPDELDIYIQKLVQLRLIVGSVACAILIASLLSWLPWYSFWLSYIGTTLLGMMWLRIKSTIKTPKKFFLVEWPKKQLQLKNVVANNMFNDNHSVVGSDISGIDYSTASTPNYGIPGYNSHGVYTGSSTAIGGISD